MKTRVLDIVFGGIILLILFKSFESSKAPTEATNKTPSVVDQQPQVEPPVDNQPLRIEGKGIIIATIDYRFTVTPQPGFITSGQSPLWLKKHIVTNSHSSNECLMVYENHVSTTFQIRVVPSNCCADSKHAQQCLETLF